LGIKILVLVAICLIPLFTIPVFAQELADFVDPKKDPESYLDRYYSEPDYREWFDKNYPHLTIEEAIGLVKPFSLIKEQYNECGADARERYNKALKDYIISGGGGIGAEMTLADRGITLDYYLNYCVGDIENLNVVGSLLYERGLYIESIMYYDRALDLYPDYMVALYNKGTALAMLGELEEAVINFDKSLKIDPNFEPTILAKDQVLEILNEDSVRPTEKIESICGKGTILKDGLCVPERATMTTEMQQKSSGGGCLIATATYGSELAPQVQMLREIRDNSLLQTQSGQSFMESFNSFYYSFSPTIADYERENPVFKEAVKVTITPLLASLSLLNYVELDSEESVLGYGIGIILMNVGMYFVAPVMVIHRIKKILNS